MWKENTLEDLEEGLLEYEIVEKFLADIRKEFGEGEEKSNKSSRTKEARARRKNDGRVCAEV